MSCLPCQNPDPQPKHQLVLEILQLCIERNSQEHQSQMVWEPTTAAQHYSCMLAARESQETCTPEGTRETSAQSHSQLMHYNLLTEQQPEKDKMSINYMYMHHRPQLCSYFTWAQLVKGQLALNWGLHLNLTCVSFSCVQKH